MISHNVNVGLGIYDCSLYTRCIALKDDRHEKIIKIPAYTIVKYNYLETLAKTILILAWQNQFIQENILTRL